MKNRVYHGSITKIRLSRKNDIYSATGGQKEASRRKRLGGESVLDREGNAWQGLWHGVWCVLGNRQKFSAWSLEVL